MLLFIKSSNFAAYQNPNLKLLARRLAVKTCLLRNQSSINFIVVDYYYLELTKIYYKMLDDLAKGLQHFLVFPKYISTGLLSDKIFCESICLLLQDELKSNMDIDYLDHSNLAEKNISIDSIESLLKYRLQ
ncbi:MAG: hypothetical protein ACRCTJ_05065 [Brevinema sp.]